MAHIYTGKNISFQHNGKFLQAGTSHASFALIVAAALSGDYAKAANLLDLKSVVQGAIKGSDMTLEGNSVMFKGREVPGILGQRILTLIKSGHTASPLQNFLSNLWENPSYRASRELYDFLEVAKLPITEDGFFLAYKSVTRDFKDHHTGKMDNSVGTLVSMPRHSVDEDKDRTCSAGLHFAAYGYASGFGSGGRMVVVKINPKDVVAIPSDYNNEKGRACAYTILEEIDRGDDKLSGTDFVDTGTTGKTVDTSAASVINVGDKVVIVKGSEHDKNTPFNPRGSSGTVVSTSILSTAGYSYKVQWDTGYTNVYRSIDIHKVSSASAPVAKEYVAPSDNYEEDDLWNWDAEFIGTHDEFPINRKSVYSLERMSTSKEYVGYFFSNYDRANSNLVFRKHNGVTFDYCTIKDLSDWVITVDEVITGE